MKGGGTIKMDDRHESKWNEEIEEIEARINTILAKVEKFYPPENEELATDEGQPSSPGAA